MPFFRKTKEKIQSQINSFTASLNGINKKLDDMSFFVAEIELLRLKIDNLEISNKNLSSQNKRILEVLTTFATAEQIADFAKENRENLSKLAASQEVSELFEKTSSEIAEFSAKTEKSISKLARAESLDDFAKTTSKTLKSLATSQDVTTLSKNTQKTLGDISKYNETQFARLATSQELKNFSESTGDTFGKLATSQQISEFEQNTNEYLSKIATAEEVAKLPTGEQFSAFEQKSSETLARLATSQELKNFAESTCDTFGKLATSQQISEFEQNTNEYLSKIATAEEVAKLPTGEQFSAFEQKSSETLARLATSQELKNFAESTCDTFGKLATSQQISEFEQNTNEYLSKIATAEEVAKQKSFVLDSVKSEDSKLNGKINWIYKKLKYRLNSTLPASDWEDAVKNEAFELTGRILNLDKPETLNEKICYLKLYDRRPVFKIIADKIAVRNYVKEKTKNENLLVKLLGVYNKFSEIDFSILPDKFAIKANHGSGYNFICKNKHELNLQELERKVNSWLSEDFSYVALEPHYAGIERKILIEEYLENNDTGLDDYKIYCFNGKPSVILYIRGRYQKKQCAFFDISWNRLSYKNEGFEMITEEIPKPQKLSELLKYSEQLSKEFVIARVDFYVLNDGTIKFGEITLTPAAGYSKINYEADLEMGRMVDIPLNIKPSLYRK